MSPCSASRARASTGRLRRTTTAGADAADRRAVSWLGRSLGSRRLTTMLRVEGITLDRKRVQRRMRRITTLGPKPKATKPVAGLQDLPVSAARPGERPAEPGVGGGHHLYPDRPRAFCIWSRSSTALGLSFANIRRFFNPRVRARCSPGGCRTPWTRHSASMPSTRYWRASARPRSSTPTRARGSPAPPSPAASRMPIFGSP